ncbi:MAG: hypothetical protein FWF56_04400 [Firmicutes bacterium]|nr:hypothetical protein [Bacillota bacterium]MCL1954215.1 hypothetical protein [Bacillota bacterium]
MEDDIFKLLMIVLLLANDKEGSKDSVFTELNTIIILGLIMGQSRSSRNNNERNQNNNERDRVQQLVSAIEDSEFASIDNPRENRRNRRVDEI